MIEIDRMTDTGKDDLNLTQKIGRVVGAIGAAAAPILPMNAPDVNKEASKAINEGKIEQVEQDTPPTQVAQAEVVPIATTEPLPNSDFNVFSLPVIEVLDTRVETSLNDYRNKQISMEQLTGMLTDQVSIDNIRESAQNSIQLLADLGDIDTSTVERRFVVLPKGEDEVTLAPILWNIANDSLLFLYERQDTLEGGGQATIVTVGSLQDHDGPGDNSRIVFRPSYDGSNRAFFFAVDQNGDNPQYFVMAQNEQGFAVETPIDEVTLGPELVGTPPAQEVALAPEAFLASYQWQPGDNVSLTRTGRGTPDQVSEYWALNIQRGEQTYNNLQVIESEYGGYIRPLGVEERLGYYYPTYIVQGIYLGQEIGVEQDGESSREVQKLVVAVPSQNGGTLILKVISPNDHNPGFSVGGSTVLKTPSQEVFSELRNVISPGAQIEVAISQTNDNMAKYITDWEAAFGRDCESDPQCQATLYAYNQSHSTRPDVIFNWWNSGNLDESHVIYEEGAIRTGALTQLIVTRPPGSTY